MTIHELINLMDENEKICIDDLEEKNVFNTELYCGAVGELKQDNPIMDMEIIGIVAVNDLISACVRKATRHYWEKYGNKRTCSKWNFSYFTGDDGFNHCPDCGAKMKESANVSETQ